MLCSLYGGNVLNCVTEDVLLCLRYLLNRGCVRGGGGGVVCVILHGTEDDTREQRCGILCAKNRKKSHGVSEWLAVNDVS